MAFMMGKVVVGPNVGNVGRILCETGNPTFVPSDMDSVIEAVEKAIQIKDVMGEKNLIWAKQEFATEIIALKYVTLYKNIKDGCTL